MDKRNRQRLNRRKEVNYKVTIHGSIPPDLAERISAIHACSLLKAARIGQVESNHESAEGS